MIDDINGDRILYYNGKPGSLPYSKAITQGILCERYDHN